MKSISWRAIAGKAAGFSLLEIIVSVAIFALLIGSIVAVFLASYNTRTLVWAELDAQNEGRRLLRDFLSEVRSAGFSDGGAYPIETAEPQQLIFYSNIDNDLSRERVRYFISGTTLKKGVVQASGNPPSYNLATEIVTDAVHNVANAMAPLFVYYDQNYTGAEPPLPTPANITAIRTVGLSLQLKKGNTIQAPLVIEAKTEIRNLKSN